MFEGYVVHDDAAADAEQADQHGEVCRVAHPAVGEEQVEGPAAGNDAQGVARELSLLENLFMNPVASDRSVVGLARLISPRLERFEAHALLQRFQVKPAEPGERVSTLSGGNAQKVIVARSLRRVPILLMVNDVSVGVDVGAREEIYEAIRGIAEAGSAVIVITSDFEEISALCSRAFVLQRGHLIAVLEGGEVTVENITARAIVGGGEAA